MDMNGKIAWPDGKDFAFSVFDDTDRSTLENVGGVYSFLKELGFRTTKSIWPLRAEEAPKGIGSTCEDQEYLAWLKQLQSSGFEIGYHMSTFRSSVREVTIRGIERFAELFGHYPKSMANHVNCRENLYWGSARISGFNRIIYNVLTRNRRNNKYKGHIQNSKYFWGDISKAKIKYVRNFVFPDINTLRACPMMPYHDADRRYVNYWFASSGGSTVADFNECISEKNQDQLEAESGACIMYAHFAFGFYQEGGLNERFKYLMKRLSNKNGWFVPVSDLLDYLLDLKGHRVIKDDERNRLERTWLSSKMLIGTR
jgi:hypothetical protein